MKFPLSWLEEKISHGLPPAELGERLTLAGLELESIVKDTKNLIFDIELTPNRSDCLSVHGIAREVAAITGRRIRNTVVKPIRAEINDTWSIENTAPEACPRYCGRVIKDINVKAKTPTLIKERLVACGGKSINIIVDIVNYVMYEVGQPMHAFDADTLQGKINIRFAKKNEEIDTLDDIKIKLSNNNLVIADQKKVLALAGIIGEVSSSVDKNTKSIFLESAFFSPSHIANKARDFKLNTESSHRYERGVDPDLCVSAIEYATELICKHAKGSPGPTLNISSKKYLPKNRFIKFRYQKIASVLGVQITKRQIESMLKSINCIFEPIKEGWKVKAPSYRFDISIEADLLEEIARLYGYQKLPSSIAPDFFLRAQEANIRRKVRTKIVDYLIAQGYHEVITYPFISERPSKKQLKISNPISLSEPCLGYDEHLSITRQDADYASKFFEIRNSYANNKEDNIEIAAYVSGNFLPEQWGVSPRQADIYDLKNDVENIISVINSKSPIAFEPDENAGLKIKISRKNIGWLTHNSFVISCNSLEQLWETRAATKFVEFSNQPAIRRDLALILNKKVLVGDLVMFIEQSNIDILKKVVVFDVFTGKGIPKNTKSVGLGLILQDFSRTLTGEEAEKVTAQVLRDLQNNFNAKIRE
jgi:phenylalanyl-tRNA synthetase beta chain